MISENDTITRLGRLRSDDGTTGTADDVAADLDRGRRAVRRRRRAVAGGALGATAVVALGAGVIATTLVGTSGDPAPSPAPTAAAAADVGGVRLAQYSGEQPNGFELAVVPEGFVVEQSSPHNVTVRDESDTDGSWEVYDTAIYMFAASDGYYPDGLEGFPNKQSTTVNGTEATLFDWIVEEGEPGNRGIGWRLPDDSGWVIVQAGSELGLTDEQIVEFASGVTVTDSLELMGA